MKESAKQKTGARSGKEESATGRNTPGKDARVLTVTMPDEMSSSVTFKICFADIITVKHDEWYEEKYKIKYRTPGGEAWTHEIGEDDSYMIDDAPVTFEKVKMYFDNRMTESAIDALPTEKD